MKWRFMKDASVYHGTEDPWYALTDGGYINPKEMLSDQKQLDELLEAISIVQSFLSAAEDAGLIGEE